MKHRGQTENIGEYVIRRPVYWSVFLLIMFLISLLLCFWDAPYTVSHDPLDLIAEKFHSLTGLSIWIPFVVVFVLLAVDVYRCLRFKLVVHGDGFVVTPLWGAAHEVAFSAVERVSHANRFSSKGYYINIEYDNKKVHIPYTRDGSGGFKQTGVGVLLERLASRDIEITAR